MSSINSYLVALNFQSDDFAMSLNEALFNDNGQCGYILKPKILRDLLLDFNPNEDPDKLMKKESFLLLKIKIISAQYLPAPENNTEMSTYVKISIHGIPSDNFEIKTHSIKGGCSPLWDEVLNDLP